MLLLSRSVRRKLLATALAAGVFTLLYQATVFDSLKIGEPTADAMGAPGVGSRVAFEATAYCRGEITAAGVAVRAGMAAADPKVLPMGSTIQIAFDRWRGPLRGHLHGRRHRARNPGPRGRPVHVELRRGRAVRPTEGRGDRPPARVAVRRNLDDRPLLTAPACRIPMGR